MKALITGAAGFLGSALGTALIEEGHEVIGIDDLSTGRLDEVHPDLVFTTGDIMDRPTLWGLLQDVECVFHLAARVAVQESVLYPREYNSTNVGGTVSLMEAMRDVGVKRVVFTSSGAVYGSQKEQPLKECMRPAPDSPYAVSKLAAEYYVKTIGALWGIETVTLRIFNAFGPGQRIPSAHPPVIANFLKQAVEEGTLVIHNSGNQSRDYVYVGDVVQALISASSASDVNGEVINVGSGKEVSVIELVDRILELTGAKAEVIHNPNAKGGVKHMRADLNKAYKLLKYQPRVSLRQGLKQTLDTDPRYQV